MKHVLLLVLFVSTLGAAVADDCADPSKTIERIEKMTSCYEAATLARECAFGSSLDIQIAGAAGDVCVKETRKMTPADQKLLGTMQARCSKAYARRIGSLYRSMHSFCNLSALEFINGVVTGAE